ncbi:hypothetical protein NDA07_26800 [Microcoleus vaginatus DQ-U2]|nr:hypothetical protein [Microcoleus sp. FACHB-DQ6]
MNHRQQDRSDCKPGAAAVGNAIGRTDKTRRLKPLLHKQSPSREGLKRGY